ncbi:MAG: DegT/DnrJ/EryC1/StrS family aminotransferase [Methylococcales bacterium]
MGAQDIKMIEAFDQPIYITRPLLPALDLFAARLREVWDAQWLSNDGFQLRCLNEELRRVLRVPYLSMFNNGTVALLVALRSLGLKGEVITTPFTFPATTHVLSWSGIVPVFCDVHPRTLTIDPKKIEELVTSKTSGILGVHVYGIPCHVDEIAAVARRCGLRVIFDAAHAFATELNGYGIGNFGDITMFSFHATKLFHTAEGGCLTFSDPDLKPRIDLLKNFGITGETEVLIPGINGKMNELQAVMGRLVLEMVADERTRRMAIEDLYKEYLGDIPGIEFIEAPSDVVHALQYFAIRIVQAEFGKSRDDVFKALRKYNVFARKYFFPLTSDYPCYQDLPTARVELLPNAHRAAREVLCLPFYGALDHLAVERICAIIRSVRNAG